MIHDLLTTPSSTARGPRALAILAFAVLAASALVGCPRTHVRGRDAGHVTGHPCGDVVCPEGLSCCNASCNLCAPPDDGCIAVVCERE